MNMFRIIFAIVLLHPDQHRHRRQDHHPGRRHRRHRHRIISIIIAIMSRRWLRWQQLLREPPRKLLAFAPGSRSDLAEGQRWPRRAKAFSFASGSRWTLPGHADWPRRWPIWSQAYQHYERSPNSSRSRLGRGVPCRWPIGPQALPRPRKLASPLANMVASGATLPIAQRAASAAQAMLYQTLLVRVWVVVYLADGP